MKQRLSVSTAYAQESLGDITFVEFPHVESNIAKGESFGVIKSVKAASDVYMPITGKVVCINKELEDAPEIINQSPYEEGWMS